MRLDWFSLNKFCVCRPIVSILNEIIVFFPAKIIVNWKHLTTGIILVTCATHETGGVMSCPMGSKRTVRRHHCLRDNDVDTGAK